MKPQGKFMYQIYLDTTDRVNNLVELRKDGDVLDSLSGEIDVVASLDELLKKHHLRISDIEDFSMNKGPGSFTGLKISAAIVNILNWSVTHKSSKDIVLPEYQVSKFDELNS